MSSQSHSQMPQHNYLNKVIATDTYFASDKSIEYHYFVQVSFSMTSKSLFVAGIKTESELSDVYFDFIRQNGILSTVQSDNTKSEVRQCVQLIDCFLVITDQWIEPQCPWQNPA
jgi:hypothetical protein